MLLGSAVDIVLSSVEERYELGDMIGVGHFSQVHCARPAGSLGEHSIALKGIEQSVLNDDEEALAMLVGECRALRLASECSALQSRVRFSPERSHAPQLANTHPLNCHCP